MNYYKLYYSWKILLIDKLFGAMTLNVSDSACSPI